MGVPRQPYEGLFIQEEATKSRSRGHALYRDASLAAYVLDPPPSRGGDLELEGGVNVSL